MLFPFTTSAQAKDAILATLLPNEWLTSSQVATKLGLKTNDKILPNKSYTVPSYLVYLLRSEAIERTYLDGKKVPLYRLKESTRLDSTPGVEVKMLPDGPPPIKLPEDSAPVRVEVGPKAEVDYEAFARRVAEAGSKVKRAKEREKQGEDMLADLRKATMEAEAEFQAVLASAGGGERPVYLIEDGMWLDAWCRAIAYNLRHNPGKPLYYLNKNADPYEMVKGKVRSELAKRMTLPKDRPLTNLTVDEVKNHGLDVIITIEKSIFDQLFVHGYRTTFYFASKCNRRA